MPSQHLQLDARIQAPIERVFDFMNDHEQFGRIWTGVTRRVQDSSDNGNVNGVDSVREIRVGPVPVLMQFREVITECRRPEYLEYKVIGLAPIKNHVGKIRFATDGDVTVIDYTIDFDPVVPGTGTVAATAIRRDWDRNMPRIIRELEQAAA